ncbi:LLM class flavin-dependent oxidoreductase [Streptomyces sp. NPDC006463]|uniref:LLM class flavin-dependent oxidoreductase n=1 Tax=Streptomyces sp. NPDC006463 TaxID=3364746 RepID=UPI0036880983
MPEPTPTPVPVFVALAAAPTHPRPDSDASPRAVVRAGGAGSWLRRLSDAAVRADRAGIDALVIRRSGAAGSAALEPATVLAAIAPRTTGIGLIAEASPASHEPYHLAREVATLDIMSGGRAGVLLDLRPDATERAAGLPARQDAQEAWQRAQEYLSVLAGLWDSFDDDAFVHDRASGTYFRSDGMHRTDHEGRYYKVAGPLNIARPPQGHPVTLATWVTSAEAPHVPDYHLTDHPCASRRPRIAPLPLAAEAPDETVERVRRLLLGERPAGLLVEMPGGPASLELFATRTLPMLREHGLVSGAPRGARTLRERLALERPLDRASRCPA